MTTFKERIEKLTNSLAETLISKNKDYGDAFGKSVERRGALAFFIRADDKMSRAENLLLNNTLVNVKDETVQDTLLDLAGYCILMADAINEGKLNKNEESSNTWN